MTTEIFNSARLDLQMIRTAYSERAELGNFCDKCLADFDDKGKRLVVLTTPPKDDDLPKVEIRFECNPDCEEVF